jgi:uncharacterized membrane protein
MNIKLYTYLLLTFILLGFLFPGTGLRSQELYDDYQGTWRGKVLEVVDSQKKLIPGTDTEHTYQKIVVEILDGPQKGKEVTIENDYLELKKGNKFYFNYLKDIGGYESYVVTNVDRRDSLVWLVFIFIVAIIIFGGWQGVRSLIALIGSFFAIFYILIPGLLNGWSPLVSSFFVASGILFVAIFFTHGFNRESLIAYIGTMISVFVTGIFAIFVVKSTSLTGFASEESTYLNIGTNGALDFTSLLLGAIIIGFLGVLDDIAVTQAAVVSELYDSNPSISKIEVYKRAMRVGREHVGALVNTLILAYTGASLPLLLYFRMSDMNFSTVVNLEIFSTEIVRSIVGSMGLILTVPIVTILSVAYLKGYKSKHSHHHHHH